MPLNNFGIVDKRGSATLYRCAQPNISGCQTLKSLNIRTIRLNFDEDLSTEQEKSYVDMDYIPISTISIDLKKINEVINKINYYLDSGVSVAVHGQKGKNRTGFIIGIYRILFNNYNLWLNTTH